MSKYFRKFEVINYNDMLSINITQRTAILNSVVNNKYAFYPYTVKNGMRAEQVAERYYDSSDYVWLVYFSNNIIDPYYDWTMSQEMFNGYIASKYGSILEAKQDIRHYRVNWYADNRRLTKEQYNNLYHTLVKYWEPDIGYSTYSRKRIDHTIVADDGEGNVTLPITGEEVNYWQAVSIYDIEEEANNDKANIRLLDKAYVRTAEMNLKGLLSS